MNWQSAKPYSPKPENNLPGSVVRNHWTAFSSFSKRVGLDTPFQEPKSSARHSSERRRKQSSQGEAGDRRDVSGGRVGASSGWMEVGNRGTDGTFSHIV